MVQAIAVAEASTTKVTTEATDVKMAPTENTSNLKYMSLVTLTVQNALLILTMRYSRLVTGKMYITTTAVVFSEFSKMVICLLIIFYQEKSLQKWLYHLHEGLVVNWKDTVKMSVPAIVYMLQNNLQYVAVSNLEPAVFQVTYQLKILTTALFSVIILRKQLTRLKWGSLVVLFVGVALVQLQSASAKPETPSHEQNRTIGLVAVLISCLSSGFAGVYFEMMLKGSNASVWLRNVQLGMFGSMTAIAGVLIKDGAQIYQEGVFVGYSALVWFVISQQAVGGLIVALVVRYADNILKGFATSLSIILSCVASVFLFDYSITLTFSAGALLVMGAIYLYGMPQPLPTSILPVTADPPAQVPNPRPTTNTKQ